MIIRFELLEPLEVWIWTGLNFRQIFFVIPWCLLTNFFFLLAQFNKRKSRKTSVARKFFKKLNNYEL